MAQRIAKRVLVVDDEPVILRFIQVHLERSGFNVSTASNGKEALQRLAQQPGIDLMITDVIMPVMDGFELLRAVREQPGLACVPIILMGSLRNEVRPDDAPGWTMEDIRKQARDTVVSKYGPGDYLPKPFAPPAMVQMVGNLLAET